MASTPSASALLAVLRCRRNIWTSPSTRLTGTTAARDPTVKPASFWDVFTHGERLVLRRLALTCNAPVNNKRRAEKVCHGLSQSGHVHDTGHARKPTLRAPCTRSIVQAKVVFVCESSRSCRVCPRQLDTAADRKSAWLGVSARSSCVSLSSRLTHFMLDRLLVLLRSCSNQDEDELRRQSDDLEISGQSDIILDDGRVSGSRSDTTCLCPCSITKHRPD